MNTGFLGSAVATVLTVYGIETCFLSSGTTLRSWVATVLTVYGIETFVTIFFIKTLRCNSTYRLRYWNKRSFLIHDTIEQVATVLTVYGIETSNFSSRKLRISLQQYLPFTVLKLIIINSTNICALIRLQQYLPFTVLKRTLTTVVVH